MASATSVPTSSAEQKINKIMPKKGKEGKEEKEECSVCCEIYDKKTHEKIVCDYGDCLFESCKSCVRTYLVGTTSDPKCMQCDKGWSDKFLVKNLNSSFVRTEYKKHRKEMLLQQQISRLPETMAAVENYKNIEKIKEQIQSLKKHLAEINSVIYNDDVLNKKIIKQFYSIRFNPLNCPCMFDDKNIIKSEIDIVRWYIHTMNDLKTMNAAEVTDDTKPHFIYLTHKLDELQKKYRDITGTNIPSLDQYYAEMEELSSKILKNKKKKEELLSQKHIIQYNIPELQQNIEILRAEGLNENITKKEMKKFIMPCTNQDCRGYLSTQYKCELCEFHTCSKCFELIGKTKNEPHKCKQENIDSAEYIRKQSKPCPCCGTRISKIDGCDQMWCTQCHKAFSWNSGRLVTGVVHNPHFYQYQRDNGGGVAPRNPGDVICGGLCAFNELSTHLYDKLATPCDNKIYASVITLHRKITHIINHDLLNIRTIIQTNENCVNERIKYIMKVITKEKLASQVMHKDIMRKKNVDILHIYELLTAVGIDMFRKIIDSKSVGMEFNIILYSQIEEFRKLCEYCNAQFKEISITYGMVVPCIMCDGWDISMTKYNVKGGVAKKSIIDRDVKV